MNSYDDIQNQLKLVNEMLHDELTLIEIARRKNQLLFQQLKCPNALTNQILQQNNILAQEFDSKRKSVENLEKIQKKLTTKLSEISKEFDKKYPPKK
jgi:hypothetical protein